MGISRTRGIIYNVIVVLAALALIGVLIWSTLISGANAGTLGAYTTSVDAARGDILDRNGSMLVTCRLGNDVTFNATAFPKEQEKRNEIIISLIQLCDANGVEYIDNLPIKVSKKTGKYVFKNKDENAAYLKWLKSKDVLNLNEYATAENCMDALIKRYDLSAYSKEDARSLASVQVEMLRNTFNTSYPYTFAEDVPTDLITIIMENKNFYRGVENTAENYRVYDDGMFAPHILGRVSGITAEKYEEKQKELEEALDKASGKQEIDELNRNAYTISDIYGHGGPAPGQTGHEDGHHRPGRQCAEHLHDTAGTGQRRHPDAGQKPAEGRPGSPEKARGLPEHLGCPEVCRGGRRGRCPHRRDPRLRHVPHLRQQRVEREVLRMGPGRNGPPLEPRRHEYL